MGDVTYLDVETRLDIPVERVLEGAQELKSVVLIGYNEEGEEVIFSSYSDGADILWLLKRIEHFLMHQDE